MNTLAIVIVVMCIFAVPVAVVASLALGNGWYKEDDGLYTWGDASSEIGGDFIKWSVMNDPNGW